MKLLLLATKYAQIPNPALKLTKNELYSQGAFRKLLGNEPGSLHTPALNLRANPKSNFSASQCFQPEPHQLDFELRLRGFVQE